MKRHYAVLLLSAGLLLSPSLEAQEPLKIPEKKPKKAADKEAKESPDGSNPKLGPKEKPKAQPKPTKDSKDTKPRKPDALPEFEKPVKKHAFDVNETLAQLKNLRGTISELNTQIGRLRRELQSKTKAEQDKILAEIKQAQDSKAKLEAHFAKVASGVDLNEFRGNRNEKFDWKKEVVELIAPLVNQVKSMTVRPRQIEKLKSEIDFYSQRIPLAEEAVKRTNVLVNNSGDKRLTRELASLRNQWRANEREVKSHKSISQHQLDELTKDTKPLWESSQAILQSFFKSRGRNLGFAIFAFLFVFIGMRLLHRALKSISPAHKRDVRPFYVRLIDVLYLLVNIFGALAAALIVLYSTGDWVLLSIAIIFMIGIAWTARQGLPKYWTQIRLLLNIGQVRENERVIYQGVPWRVASLNLYTKLVNPAFGDFELLVPLNNLIGMTSRRTNPNEPWFPTNNGDWVLLSDGTWGRVASQTHECVVLNLPGGAVKSVPTGSFLGANPTNYSRGFRVAVHFGVDYDLQEQAMEDIPRGFKAQVTKMLAEQGYSENLQALGVEFANAASSALEVGVYADFSGAVAADRSHIERLIQRTCVETCTLHDWSIPYDHIVIQQKLPSPAPSAPAPTAPSAPATSSSTPGTDQPPLPRGEGTVSIPHPGAGPAPSEG